MAVSGNSTLDERRHSRSFNRSTTIISISNMKAVSCVVAQVTNMGHKKLEEQLKVLNNKS